MPDFERDPGVDRLLKDVGNTVAGYLDPPGVAGVYATVRQRRRNRAVAVGVLALAVVGGPTVGLALTDRSGPPAGGEPSVTASEAVPSPSDSASPPPSSSASVTPAAPDGRISLADLKHARLDLPAWPPAATPECRQGKGVEFVGQPIYTDVDHDGAVETVAWLHCQAQAEYKIAKVVAFDRDASGSIVTLGQVLQTPSGGDEGVGIWKVWGVQATDDGRIRIDVGEYWPCCGVPAELPQHQWRTYGWDGRRFVQTGGPTRFGPNPKIIDIAPTADDVVMTQQADGTWRGTLTVKVRNPGSLPAWIEVVLDGRFDGIGPGWDKCDGALVATEESTAWCDGGTVAPGRTVTLSLTLSSPSRPSGAVAVRAYQRNVHNEEFPDPHPANNGISVAVRAG